MFLFFPWTRLEHYQKKTWSERHHLHHSLFQRGKLHSTQHYCFAKTRLSKKDSPQESWLMVQTCITRYPNKEIFKKHCFIFSLLWFLTRSQMAKERIQSESRAVVKAIKQFTSNNGFPSAEVVEFVVKISPSAEFPRHEGHRIVSWMCKELPSGVDLVGWPELVGKHRCLEMVAACQTFARCKMMTNDSMTNWTAMNWLNQDSDGKEDKGLLVWVFV